MANIPQDFLFRYRFPCRRFDSAILTELSGAALDEKFRLPIWTQNEAAEKFAQNPRLPRTSTPRSPENENRFDFRVGWAPEGFVFTAVVREKRRFVRRAQTELNGADCVRLCLDVRDVKEARRAGKYCFKFLFYPLVGESDDGAKPLAIQAPINRAKAAAPAIEVGEFRTATDVRSDGYALSAFLPSDVGARGVRSARISAARAPFFRSRRRIRRVRLATFRALSGRRGSEPLGDARFRRLGDAAQATSRMQAANGGPQGRKCAGRGAFPERERL